MAVSQLDATVTAVTPFEGLVAKRGGWGGDRRRWIAASQPGEMKTFKDSANRLLTSFRASGVRRVRRFNASFHLKGEPWRSEFLSRS